MSYKLRDFEIIRELGTGAQSFVKLARHVPSQRYVALKVLSKHYYEKRKQVPYAFSEKELLPLCASPFAVEYLGSFHTPNFAFLVLDYVKGIELFELLQLSQNGLSLSLTRFISAQIVLFLELLHQQRILYRDLKPENVMVQSDGYIKIVDFGLATRLNRHGKKSNPCGTLSYFCPEKLQYQPYDERSDWWSFGVLLYEMLTNRLLFPGKTPEEVLVEVNQHKIVYPAESAACNDDSVRNLIRSLLQLDPARRPSLAQIKKHPFYREVNWTKLAQKKIVIKSQCLIDLLEIKDHLYQPSVVAKKSKSKSKSGSSSRSRRNRESQPWMKW